MRSKREQQKSVLGWIALSIELTIWFTMMGVVGVPIYKLISLLQQSRCPPDSYVTGSGNAASIFIIIPIFFASLVPGLLLSNVVTGITAGTRKFFDGTENDRNGVSFRYSKRFKKEFSISAVYIAPVLIPLLISITSSFSQFCLAPDQITNRTFPWSSIKTHTWHNVVKIETTCERAGKNSWEPGFLLNFEDGSTLNIMGGTGSASKHGDDIHQSLAGKNFDFDNSRVDPDCGVANPQMLLTKP